MTLCSVRIEMNENLNESWALPAAISVAMIKQKKR